MFRLIYALYKMKLLSPLGMFSLVSAIYKHGINIMALLGFAEKVYGKNTAIVDDDEALTYEQLYIQSSKLSVILSESYSIKPGHKVGFLCKNHASLVKSIFAISQLGADIYLLNTEMSSSQLQGILERNDFDLIIYDSNRISLLEESSYRKAKVLSYHEHIPAINNLLNKKVDKKTKYKRTSSSKIILLTSGTTGKAKNVAHKPSIFNYLNPFLTLINRLNLLKYHTAYIATPIYHGYGIAILLLFTALGKKIVLSYGFDAKKACSIVRKHHVEVITVVPLMIHKMLKHHVEDLKPLSCIASGGAELNPRLVNEVFKALGDVLYNLYGTSEAGLNIVATPKDLHYSPKTVGKKINGVHLKIVDEEKNEVQIGKVGHLCIKNSWSMRNRKSTWVDTGDLGYQDCNGYFYLAGRVDDMVVSAGENVYPIEVEQVLINHPQVEDVAVIGIHDEDFGQRLMAIILPVNHANLTKEELLEWLRPRIARFQLPKDIIFVDQMPYTPLGKLDKKRLKMQVGSLSKNINGFGDVK